MGESRMACGYSKMMASFQKGHLKVRIADGAADLAAIKYLRHRCFGTDPRDGDDWDAFDPKCLQMLVEDVQDQQIVCCFRMLPLSTGDEIDNSYSAQFYELSALRKYHGPMMELGRFCVDPDRHDPDIVRIAWAAITRYVDEMGVEMLFGCSSFKGTNADEYLDAFAMLKEGHLAPRRWWPRVKAPSVFKYAQKLKLRKPDLKLARLRMPPLLRTYLLMGGWVSDHAVVDQNLNTLHVFTGVEIGTIPDSRKRLLRASAQ